MIPIFDSHLDLAWNALSFNRDLTISIERIRQGEAHMSDMRCRGRCTTCLPELKQAGVPVCLATLLARGGPGQTPQNTYLRTDLDHATQSIAHAVARGQLAYYRLLEDQGWLRFIRTADELRDHWESLETAADAPNPLGIILSMEGADPIVSPSQAQAWWDEGLRVASLAHYGRSHYAYGTGVEGPLSAEGVALLEEFQRIGMVLDVTHLCDRSFWEALEVFEGPVLASHHNCRSLVPHERQLNDLQIKRLLERGAVIGTALDAWMLYPGWERGKTAPEVLALDSVADHMDHVCQMAGDADHAAIGSDLDGGFGTEQTPGDLDTIADLQKLGGILAGRGYSTEDVGKIFHGNWLRFFLKELP